MEISRSLVAISYLVVGLSLLHQAVRCQFPSPVIIDTDVGSFLDDSFAIVYAVQSPLLDVKLIVTCTGDTTARAKVVAKLLKSLGGDDIPIGVGIRNANKTRQSLMDWGAQEDLSTYKGGVFEDGVHKMAEVIMSVKGIVEIIAIGPMTNFPTLIEKYPGVVPSVSIRAMAGSINVGYDGSMQPAAEYNVYMCPWCMDVMLRGSSVSWYEFTITPLDTCGNVVLSGDQIQRVLQGDSRAATTLASTLTFFCIQESCNLKDKSPILFDVIGTLIAIPVVAVRYIDYSLMNLTVNSTGYTVVDNQSGKPTNVALSWKQGAENIFIETLVTVYGKDRQY